MVSKNNEKYLKLHKNVHHVKYFYPIIVRRYIDRIVGKEIYSRINDKYRNINSFFRNHRFESVDKQMYDLIKEVGEKISSLNSKIDHVSLNYKEVKKWFGLDIDELSNIENLDFYNDLNKCLEYDKKNVENINMFSLPWGGEDLSPKFIMMLQLALEN
jgi:hypothetical protein